MNIKLSQRDRLALQPLNAKLNGCIKLLLVALAILLATTVNAGTQRILILGDSLSAAHGIEESSSWVTLLSTTLKNDGVDAEITNASISGETTGGALARLPKLIENHQPSLIVIELGGNDGLRGFPINTFRNNLDQLIARSLAADAKVLLLGIQIPPNYGPRYTQLFYESYREMAQKHAIPLVPFMLENVATRPELMQADGIHPTAEAQPLILQNVLPYLKKILSTKS